jgi:hypothetical protein
MSITGTRSFCFMRVRTHNSHLYLVQGILVQFGTMAELLWTVVIFWTLYRAVTSSVKLSPLQCHMFAWLGAGVLTAIPLALKSMGYFGDTHYCWIEATYGRAKPLQE